VKAKGGGSGGGKGKTAWATDLNRAREGALAALRSGQMEGAGRSISEALDKLFHKKYLVRVGTSAGRGNSPSRSLSGANMVCGTQSL